MNLQIDMIAPSHGVIWRDNPNQIVEKYAEWADSYQENQITVAYDTMWQGTEKLAHAIAHEINKQSPNTVVKVYNIARTDKNELMTEVFKSRAIAVGSPTCVNDVLTSVAGWLSFLKTLKFQGKKAAAFGCYGWSGESVKIIQEKLVEAGFEVVDDNVRSLWNPEEDDFEKIPAMVEALLKGGEAQKEEIAEKSGDIWVCDLCGWEYTENGEMPEDFKCLLCGATKEQFHKK